MKIENMSEDDFYNMITNPVFHFMEMENRAGDDPEGQKAKFDGYRAAFRERYSEKVHGTEFETLFCFFAAGFDAALNMANNIISKAREE